MSAALSERVGKLARYPPLCEMEIIAATRGLVPP